MSTQVCFDLKIFRVASADRLPKLVVTNEKVSAIESPKQRIVPIVAICHQSPLPRQDLIPLPGGAEVVSPKAGKYIPVRMCAEKCQMRYGVQAGRLFTTPTPPRRGIKAVQPAPLLSRQVAAPTSSQSARMCTAGISSPCH